MPDDPELTPQEERVRRLLADARHTEPMPDDVVARLDGVLADLRRDPVDAERPARLPAAPAPADLAGARRRRTVRNLLVAAAAVVAVGVGLNEADLTVSGGAEDSGAGSGAGAGAQSAPAGEADQPAADGADSFLRDQAPVRLTSERFGPQVRRLQAAERSAALYGTTTSQSDAKPERNELDAIRASCSTEGWGAGRRVAVRYDGDLGALVYRRAHGETQVVDLYLCGSDQPTRSITLPAR
ncbi:hypothetical protein [Nocardioides sp.]|uniref:hypothetical protein n=1 Tax=Nocardioides sp. TaxID=35761 RepID=UPI002617ADD4|nr:hypothetical protein [Nocardioides sp.]MDI6910155.1 hypothetical protein [Nocardioides sp.]